MTRRQGSLFPDMPPTKKFVVDFPELVAEWHPSKNGSKLPEDTNFGSGIKVWWLCGEGHEWQASPNTRTNRKSGCPHCAAIRVGHTKSLARSDYNLTTVNPELCKEWNSRNKRAAATYLPKSSAKVWWRCRENPEHEWQAVIGSRTSLEGKTLIGCPFCAGKRPSKKHNLLIKSPSLAEQWHPERNTKKPEHFTPSSHKKVWWICHKGHEFQARIDSRNRKSGGSGCPYCSPTYKKASPENNLTTTHPSLLAFFHPTRNEDIRPDQITAGAIKGIWWRCPNDESHEFKRSPNHMSSSKASELCPYCAGTYVSSANCMATTNPELAKFFHPMRNGSNTVFNTRATDRRYFWWVCPSGHEWEKSASAMVRRKGSLCFTCRKAMTKL